VTGPNRIQPQKSVEKMPTQPLSTQKKSFAKLEPDGFKTNIPTLTDKSLERKDFSKGKSLNGSFIGRGTSFAMSLQASLPSGVKQSPQKMASPKSLKGSEQSPAKDVTSLALEYLQGRNAALEEDLIKTYDERGSQ
jgi:hypothetical protein